MSSWIGRALSIGQSAPVAIALLLLANLIPLAGVLFFGWDVALVLITYWLENGIVGLINVPKIILARGERTGVNREPAARYVNALFFLVHYGTFWIVHGVFVFVIVGRGSPADVTDPIRAVLAEPGLVLAALALLASHGASFLYNYIGRGEYLRTTPDAQTVAPYARMAILHITIVLGGIFVISRGQPLIAVVLLVVLKTAVDLFFHLREHRGRGPEAQGKTGPNASEAIRGG